MTDKPSKSARKRDAQAVEALGERLLALSDEQLATVVLDDELRAVVETTRKMRARSALRRQRLFLAKTLRQRDVEPIELALKQFEDRDNNERRLFHLAERWRDRILQEGKTAMQEFEDQHGAQSAQLQKLLGDLRPSLPAALRQRIKRDIFREIRRLLAEQVQ